MHPRQARPGTSRSPPAGGRTWSRRRRSSRGWSRRASSHASTALQQLLDALELAGRQQGTGVPGAEHGPLAGRRRPAARRASARSASSCRLWRIAGHRQLDQVGRPVDIAAGHRVADGLGPFAVQLVPVARPPVQRRDARRALVEQARQEHVARTGGGSDTTGAGRRAGRGTGCRARAPPASPCPRSCPVTASHSGPFMRARIEVSSRNLRTSSGWRRRTSSMR